MSLGLKELDKLQAHIGCEFDDELLLRRVDAESLIAMAREALALRTNMVLASQALHDFACRFRDFEDVASAIARNTGKPIEEARSIARRQDDEARRLGATCEAALAYARAVLSKEQP